YLFLPPLIFESAIILNTRLLSRNLFPVLGLAIFGVVISAVITGLLVSHIFAMPLLYALLFGALISATDPVAVISLFKEIGVPKRLQILVEGESLLNDAASIVMFQLILTLIGASLLSEKISLVDTSIQFTSTVLTSFLGGILIGALIGVLLRFVLKQTPLHSHIHQTATMVAAYLSYLISDHLGFSGVVAVVVCGCVAARAASDWIGPARRDELTRFWEYIGFLANSLIFLLVGIAIASLQDLSVFLNGAIIGIILLIAIVTISRFIPVFGIFGLYNLFTPRKVPLTYQMVSFWGGIRGAVAIALSLSLHPSLPYRDAIVAFSVTIVLYTVLVQGLTIAPLIHHFGLGQTRLMNQFHQIYTELVAFRAGEKSLQNSVMGDIIDPATAHIYIKQYLEASALQVEKIQNFWTENRKNPERKNILKLFWLEALRFEQQQYRLLYDEGLILPAVYAELQYQTATREDLIQSGDYHPGNPETGPGTKFRRWIQKYVTQIAPKSRLSRFLIKRSEMNRIFGAAAIVMAASGTIRYLTELAAVACLNPDEITDILAVYHTLEAESREYLQSDSVMQSGSLKVISAYLAQRTAEAGMIAMLHQDLEEGAGDEKTLTLLIDQLIGEKNAARRELIRACKERL
ncbi:MAG: sodium:proton antiporter, partial [Methanobacteriota archaeon]